MKIIKPFSILTAVVVLIAVEALSFNNTSNQDSKKHVVTLYVNTDSISNERYSISKYSNFGQNNGIPNEEYISNEDYTIMVNVGDEITWEGISTSSTNDTVKIKKIRYFNGGGRNIFDKDSLSGNEKVFGKVLRHTRRNKPYKYTIFFTVTNNGTIRNGTFKIDPKIQVDR